MLKSWSIENFKPIVNSGELKLAPVTVLAGLNSSGKSSLLQSILMISQTLSSRVLDRPLLPNGPIVQLGTFEDILSDFSVSRKMTLSFELSFELLEFDLLSNYKVMVTFAGADTDRVGSSAVEASKVVVEDVSLKFNLELDLPVDGENEEVELIIDPFKGIFLVRKMSDREFEDFWSAEAVRDSLSSFVGKRPNHLGEFTSHEGVTPEVFPKLFLVSLSHFLPRYITPIHVGKDEVLSDFSHTIATNIKDQVNIAVNEIARFFTSKIRYIGPLRAEPWTTQQRFAPSGELDEVGTKGEYAAMVYHSNQNALVEWYNPETKQIEQGTLRESLDNWAQYLDVANQVRTEAAGASGVTWTVVLKQDQVTRTFPQVGVGVSQILPILVMGLLAPQNTLLIIEQPELHLHPRLQARLGDFFVGLAKCNKQCLIETHSENLVNQLRYHIVQSGGQDKSDCIIYFVDQDEKGAAKFEPVEISPKGNILNWPEGFFDETMQQEDRITAESIKRRANVARNG